MAAHSFTSRIIVVLVFVFLVLRNIAYANDGALEGNGSVVYPIGRTSVQMKSERVVATYSEATSRLPWSVEVEHELINHGEATTVLLGFPFEGYGPESSEPPTPNFKTWVDGQEVRVDRAEGKSSATSEFDYDFVFTSPVAFKAGQTRRVRHTYSVGGTRNSDGAWEFKYIIKTGALWDRDIESAVIEFRLTPEKSHQLQSAMPLPTCGSDDANGTILKWTFADFKPTEDIVITGREPGSTNSPAPKRVWKPCTN